MLRYCRSKAGSSFESHRMTEYALFCALPFNTAYHICEKGICNVRNDHTHRAGAAHSQATSHLIRVVIQRVHCFLHAFYQCRFYCGLIVENAGHRGDGNSGESGNITDGVQVLAPRVTSLRGCVRVQYSLSAFPIGYHQTQITPMNRFYCH